MSVSAIHHYTMRCVQRDLPVLFEFYRDVVGLHAGPRPDFDVDGYWLYSGSDALVHLFVYQGNPTLPQTGPLDHIAFRAHDLVSTRKHLAAMGVEFDELPVPGYPLHQVFFHDPKGLKVELNFSLEDEARLYP